MTRLLSLLLGVTLLWPSISDARRRRRHRRKRKIRLIAVDGRVVPRIKRAKGLQVRGIRWLRRYRSKAYWRYYDPILMLPRTLPLSQGLVAVVYGVPAIKKEQTGDSETEDTTETEVSVRGFSFSTKNEA